jgi:hypothetical protein
MEKSFPAAILSEGLVISGIGDAVGLWLATQPSIGQTEPDALESTNDWKTPINAKTIKTIDTAIQALFTSLQLDATSSGSLFPLAIRIISIRNRIANAISPNLIKKFSFM